MTKYPKIHSDSIQGSTLSEEKKTPQLCPCAHKDHNCTGSAQLTDEKLLLNLIF